LLEAKSPGFEWAVENDEFISNFDGAHEFVDQALRQIAAARGIPIIWHVAEPEAARAIKLLYKDNHITQIRVVWTPVKS